MIHAAMLLFVAVPSEMPASTAAMPAKTPSKSCREMLLSSSRLGMIKVCKTRAEWRRFDSCHSSVTRYCTPKKKQDRLLSAWRSDRIVCKDIKETGSRLHMQRVCSPARDWRLAEEEAQKVLMDRQSRSMLTGGSEPVQVSPPR